ncbi:MAG: hypothetical protein ACOCUI_02770, partial [bacterium]
MKKSNIRKNILIIFSIALSVFLLTGCSNSDSVNETINNDRDVGYVEGYVYKTSDGNYTLNEEEGTEPAEGVIIKIEDNIYKTNTE